MSAETPADWALGAGGSVLYADVPAPDPAPREFTLPDLAELLVVVEAGA